MFKVFLIGLNNLALHKGFYKENFLKIDIYAIETFFQKVLVAL